MGSKETTEQIARLAFSEFDAWAVRNTERAEITTTDVTVAVRSLRRLDVTLRTADAVNIAIAQRIDATLMSFDEQMAVAAKALGVTVAAA